MAVPSYLTLSCVTLSVSFTTPNVVPGALNSQHSSADKEKKGGRTEAPVEKTKPTQRMRLQITCEGCHHPVQTGIGYLSHPQELAPNSEAGISTSK